MTDEEFAAASVERVAAADDEAILATASFVVGKGSEYLTDWYDRLATSIQNRRTERGDDAGGETS